MPSAKRIAGLALSLLVSTPGLLLAQDDAPLPHDSDAAPASEASAPEAEAPTGDEASAATGDDEAAADADAATPVTPTTSEGTEEPAAPIHLELEANQPGVSWYIVHRDRKAPAFCPAEYWRPECWRTIERYQPLCIAPCSIDLAPAELELALSMHGNTPIPAAPHLDLSAEGALHADYTSRRRIRIAGGVVMAALVSFGLFNVIAGAWGDNDFYGNDDGGRNHLIIGFSSIAVGFGAGMAMVVRKDEVRIEFGAP